MASTSTQLQQDGASFPSGSSSWKYDVFMSFRGRDTRDGFVEHLYSALYKQVIFTFKDNQWLERGESISPALVKAIEESRFAVVVFSKNYASSKWCLEELVKILECKKKRVLTVLLVFYKVDPSDLRKQRGSVGEAFAQHERDSSEEKVQRWRNALTEAADLCGWNSETHGPEAKLVGDIAINILNRLGYNGSSDLEDDVGLLLNGLDYLSNDLRLLDWHGYPLKYLPSNFQPDNLVTVKPSIDMSMCLDKLKYVDFSYSPCTTKNIDFTQGANPTELIPEGFTNLVEISSIEAIKRLTVLNLRSGKNLEVLPSGICGLKRLSILNVSGCSKLEKEPMGFELPALSGLRSLTELDLSDCNFSEGFLPDDLGSLSSLQYLHLSGSNIISLPTSIKYLYQLRYLDLRNCKKLKTLPYLPTNYIMAIFASGCTSLGLRSLTVLDLSDCNFSEGLLPNDLGSLSSLESLCLSGTNIINLPISIRDLHELQYLYLRNCKKLNTLPYLSTNTIIAVNGCTSLETLTDPAIFPVQKLKGSITNCHTLIKNRPSRLLEFFRNILKNNKESHIVVPEREIPKYVGVQLRPDWYQRLRGFVVCAVFEETAPSIDDECYAECDVMWNDVVVHSTRIYIGSVQFQSDPLFLHNMALHDWVGEIRRRAEVNDLKKNEFVFYFRRSCPEIVDIVAAVKCAVHIV